MSLLTLLAAMRGGGAAPEPEPPLTDWPSLPVGYELEADTTFDTDYVYAGGGVVSYNGFDILTFDNQRGALVADATAPSGTGQVLTSKHAEDVAAGETLQLELTTAFSGKSRLFAPFIFKVGTTFDNEQTGTKMHYPVTVVDGVGDGSKGQIFTMLHTNGSSTGPFRIRIEQIYRWYTELTDYGGFPLYDNQNGYSFESPYEIERGVWYRMEIEMIAESAGLSDGPYDGELRIWFSSWDGSAWSTPVKTMEYTDVRYSLPSAGHPVTSVGFNGNLRIWDFYRGGSGDPTPPTVDGFIYFDRFAVYTEA